MNRKMLKPLRSFILHLVFLGLSGLSAAANPNAAPPVMPSLREWTGGTGSLKLATNALITIDAKYTNELASTALVLRGDLKQITQQDYRVVAASGPQPGNIYLT